MRRLTLSLAAAAALATVPVASHAIVYTFNAALTTAAEVPAPNVTGFTPSGLATLSYDDKGTAMLGDDTYDLLVGASGLTSAPTMAHIHGPAAVGATSGAKVTLAGGMVPAIAPGFIGAIGSNSIVVLGSNRTPPAGPMVGPVTTSPSFLSMLQSGLAYVNIHTVNNGPGELRGQLIQVTAVPEPSTYAMLFAGLGVVGLIAHRRRRQG